MDLVLANDVCLLFFFMPCQDNEKRTPLHAAAYLGDAEIIELLILSGKHCSTTLLIESVQIKVSVKALN